MICPTPTPGTGPPQTIPHLRARRAGLVPGIALGGGGGDGTGQIEPCIIRHAVRLSSVKTKGEVIVTKFLLNLRAQLRIRLVRSECLMEGSQTVVCISDVRTPAWRAR